MKHSCILLLLGVAFAFLCGLGVVLRPHDSESPPRLKIVRQGVEHGRTIVFFKVEPSDRRKIQIKNLKRFSLAGGTDESEPKKSWTPQSAELNDPNKSCQVFKVVAPQNAAQWKLLATVTIQTRVNADPLTAFPGFWRYYRSKTNNWFKSAWLSVYPSMFGSGGNLQSEAIESDVITNGAAFASQVSQ